MELERETVLEWYQKNHSEIDAPCGGRGECGRCKIRFWSDAPNASEKEKARLSVTELEQGIRLACETERNGREDFTLLGDVFADGIRVDLETREMSESPHNFKMEPDAKFGIALDIGTTTLAIRLVRLDKKESRFFTLTAMNHQRAYGADVISRIQAANGGKLQELQKCIQQDVFAMLVKTVAEAGISPKQVEKIAIAGNTTMCHLLLGYSCEGLGQAPFKPENIELMKISAQELFDEIEGSREEEEFLSMLETEVVILPGISAFVGADIVAGMYYCDMDLQKEKQMLLDVGTNGEMVIGNSAGFIVTSTAAGPVFEGGKISCGMPAVRGAIAHFKNGTCEVIGDVKPQGICGSGLVDLVAHMLEEAIIDENGTLGDAYFTEGYPIGMTEDSCNLRLTQTDIRELQMGKAAIRAGIEVLMEKYRPEKIYLAGGFGAAIDADSAAKIELFPKELLHSIKPVGNAALEGTHKFLLDKYGEERVRDIVQKSQEILLAKEVKFEENYIHFMQFLI